MKTGELAKRLGVAPYTVRRWEQAGIEIPGQLPKTKGGQRRYRECKKLEDWIKAHPKGIKVRRWGRPPQEIYGDPRVEGPSGTLVFSGVRWAIEFLAWIKQNPPENWPKDQLQGVLKELDPICHIRNHIEYLLKYPSAKSKTIPSPAPVSRARGSV